MPTNDSKTYIVNDQSTEDDALDFMPYVETLADIIQTGNTPLTIGVFGTWGSGKTSLMKMIRKRLPSDFTVAWFDSWKYDKEESLWRALLLCVLNALKERASLGGKPVEEFEKLQSLIYRDMEIEKVGEVTIDLAKLGGVAAKGLAQISLSFIPGLSSLTKLVEELQSGAAKDVDEATAAIRRERTKIYIEQIQFLEQFQNKFRELVNEYVKPNRFVIFVDDLDRCLPEKAIGVLEAIKLFLDAENCVFILGLDQEVIARSIEMKYRGLGSKQTGDNQTHFTVEGVHYLEKIIQLPFQIPPIEQADMGKFVYGLSSEWPQEECHNIFAEGLGDNPRQIKRAVNSFFMLWNLAEKRQMQKTINSVRLAKVVAILNVAPQIYNLLRHNYSLLRDIELFYRTETLSAEVIDLDSGKKISMKEAIQPQLSENLITLLNSAPAIRRIFSIFSDFPEANFKDVTYEELKAYFTLTRRAETPTIVSSSEISNLVYEPQMIKISGGPFLMGSTKGQVEQSIKDGAEKTWIEWEQPQNVVELSEFHIGKYPITNREYQHFIIDSKHRPPLAWNGTHFPPEKGEHPVVKVSWEDANKYCEWLSQKTEKKYRLPTEAEWEKAARGEDGRIWSWGNDFIEMNTNTNEIKLGGTTPTGQFSPQGDSPYGCSDMIGNVWEWCNDWFEGNEYKNRGDKAIENPKGPETGETRVIRGGSFSYTKGDSRCASRLSFVPKFSLRDIGFRVACSLINSEDEN
jgi:formylglycine-generating enzyme required for sulfatase activity